MGIDSGVATASYLIQNDAPLNAVRVMHNPLSGGYLRVTASHGGQIVGQSRLPDVHRPNESSGRHAGTPQAGQRTC